LCYTAGHIDYFFCGEIPQPVEQVERLTGIRPNMPRWMGLSRQRPSSKDVKFSSATNRSASAKYGNCSSDAVQLSQSLVMPKATTVWGGTISKGSLVTVSMLLSGCGFNLRKLFRCLMPSDAELA